MRLKSIYNKNKVYTIFHWFIHLLISHLLTFFSGFRLINYTIDFQIFNITVNFPIFDYILIYIFGNIIDLDHIKVLRKYGIEGLLKFAKKRIQYPLHNFLIIASFSLVSSILALANIRELSIILLAPVFHLLWDMVEDVFIFKVSYRKWEKTWGIGTKELEILWKEMQKLEKKSKTKL
jgi:hypothetical protein